MAFNLEVASQGATGLCCFRGKLNFTSRSVTLMTVREGVDLMLC